MNQRTTFSLDLVTMDRLKRLSMRWKVSQAEAVRRSIELALREEEGLKNSLQEQLALYHHDGGLDEDAANVYLMEVAEGRAEWREGK